ncbi:MAG: hypothetical protein CM1200mP24_07100 [Gammaproteobacteria bacterium]|nr:MAG: hypothetical protein CM1200mP24_07100 [Gammaproteobacteria bacterium]
MSQIVGFPKSINATKSIQPKLKLHLNNTIVIYQKDKSPIEEFKLTKTTLMGKGCNLHPGDVSSLVFETKRIPTASGANLVVRVRA